MNAFTLIFLVTFVGDIVVAILGKVKNNTLFRDSATMLMIAGIIYYAVAPILLIPIPLPLILIAQCIGFVCLLISIKRLVHSLLA